jgi:cysteine desulfurase
MIYLDHNATTPLLPEVREAMRPWMEHEHGNPSSGHGLGRRAADAVEQARASVAALISGRPEEIVFTSGGTESNNWAIFGFARAVGAEGRPWRILTSTIEHPAVSEPLRVLSEDGWRVDRIGVTAMGIVDLRAARSALDDDTAAALVSVMTAHNETGAIQPIAGLARIAHEREPATVVHTDAAQAVGKIPIAVGGLGVDALTIAGHKLYAPKGIGALWVREGVVLPPLMYGGGQQGGRRPGTEPVAQIVGLGAACARAARVLAAETRRLSSLRERLWAGLQGVDGIRRTLPDFTPCLPNTLHVCVPGIAGGDILARCPELAASTGSACHTGDGTVSGVLGEMGIPVELAAGALRLTLGAGNDEDAIDRATSMIVSAISEP